MKELENLPKTRSKALETNSKHYYTGPCKEGHDAPRITSSRRCVICNTEYMKRHRAKNNKRMNEIANKYRNAHRTEIQHRDRERYNNDLTFNSWKKRQIKEYGQKRRDKILAGISKRRARKLNATPIWLTKEDEQTIELLYQQSIELTEKQESSMSLTTSIHYKEKLSVGSTAQKIYGL